MPAIARERLLFSEPRLEGAVVSLGFVGRTPSSARDPLVALFLSTALKLVAPILLLLAGASVSRSADTHQDIVDLFASMTAALAEDNADGFMKPIDRNMPGYADLKRQIAGLILDYEISSSVESISDEAQGSKRVVDLDWFMELTSRAATGATPRRRKVIHCELELQGKHWRILSLKPISFFSDKDE